jgi:sialidase-1
MKFEGIVILLVAGLALMVFFGRKSWSAEGGALGEENQIALFVSGEEGYHTFRIPALYVTQAGTVLAFCEGRKSARSDTGDIDTVLKRSLDGGKTWGDLQVVAEDEGHTMGNPCPVQDRATGRIWLPLTRNRGDDSEREIKEGTSQESRSVWVAYSDDEGATWSPAREITATTKAPDWTWYATGPGNGIQLSSGRLFIPCDHAEAGTKMFRSHAIWSDDGGQTWVHGQPVGDKTNECQAVELPDGSVLMNMRSYEGKNLRAISKSRDGGETWEASVLDEELIEPVCQASFIRYSGGPETGDSILLFSNPASRKREKMTVKLSRDEGDSWPVARQVYPGPSAYSSLGVLPDGSVGLLYERGREEPYETITFARFTLEWLNGESSEKGEAR